MYRKVQEKNADAAAIAKTTPRLRGPKLIVTLREEEGVEFGEEVESLLSPFPEPGASAAEGTEEGEAATGEGAGAPVGGILVPKIDTGRRTLSTS